MSISNIDQIPKPALAPAEGLPEKGAVKGVSRDNAGFIRFLKQGDISALIAGNLPVGDMPLPKVPKQLGEAVSSATSTFNGMDTQDMTTDLYAIMGLIFKVYSAERKNDFDIRQAGYQKQAKDQYAAADEMRAAGKDRMWGAVVAGVGEMLGGAVMVTGGVLSAQQSFKAGELQRESGELIDAFGEDGKAEARMLEGLATQATGRAEFFRTGSHGISSVATGGGGLIRGIAEKYATERDAEKMNLEATGRTQEQMTQQVGERMSQLQDAMRDVLSKLSSIEQSRQDINRGILRNL